MSNSTFKTLHWLLLLSGVWLIIAPFLLGGSLSVNDAALWSDVIIGVIVGLIALIELFGTEDGQGQ